MTKPAFLVDGQTEQRALQKICPGNPIRIIGCNGKDVNLKAIAKRVATHIKLFNNRHYPIVVVIDRENRTQSVANIKSELQMEIEAYNLNIQVLIGVCDRMIENWILADLQNFLKYIGSSKTIKEKIIEGSKGKSILRKYHPHYHETTHGVELLLTCDPKKLYSTSPSFRDFANTIRLINCAWTSMIKFEEKEASN